jgi:hypothetical protein
MTGLGERKPVQSFGVGKLVGRSSIMNFDDLSNNKKCFTARTNSEKAILLVFKSKACDILFNEDKVDDMESLAIFIYKQSIPNVHLNYTFRRMFDICENHIETQWVHSNEVIYKEGEVNEWICILKEG